MISKGIIWNAITFPIRPQNSLADVNCQRTKQLSIIFYDVKMSLVCYFSHYCDHRPKVTKEEAYIGSQFKKEFSLLWSGIHGRKNVMQLVSLHLQYIDEWMGNSAGVYNLRCSPSDQPIQVRLQSLNLLQAVKTASPFRDQVFK